MYVVDLFCGCGGFSTGAEKAGHTIVLAIDAWDKALEAHQYNHPKTTHIQMELGGDLKETKDLIMRYVPKGKLWHLHGSPPCQNLSVANRTAGDTAEGMRLVTWYLNLVKLCRPTSWSMEQVIGARHHLNEADFEQFHIINTADYKVPQTRKRLFVGAGWELPAPLGMLTLDDKLPWLREEGDLIKGYKNTISVKNNGEHTGNRKIQGYEGFKTIYEPTYTVCAAGPLKLYVDTKQGPVYVRDLTVEEHLLIQGFPDTYNLPRTISKGDQFTLVGNAVAPPVAFLIMKK